MFEIKREMQGSVPVAVMIGVIDEKANIEEAMGTVGSELVVNCAQVDRMNSIGVKGWIRYFSKLRDKSVKLSFIDCSFAIIDQSNQISNFVKSAEIQSLQVPFSCGKCSHPYKKVFQKEELEKLAYEVADEPCPSCKEGTASFDDIPSVYFGVLMAKA